MCDYGLTLGDLLGVLREFFERLGLGSRLRFKPAYNPYTEPSMEIFSYSDELGKWMEVSGSTCPSSAARCARQKAPSLRSTFR